MRPGSPGYLAADMLIHSRCINHLACIVLIAHCYCTAAELVAGLDAGHLRQMVYLLLRVVNTGSWSNNRVWYTDCPNTRSCTVDSLVTKSTWGTCTVLLYT